VAGAPSCTVDLTLLALLGLPVAAGLAVLKYRLYDIDFVINKSLVYGALAALITAVYVAIVVGAGTLLGSGGRPNLALSVLATAVVAVAFQPVRERLQRLANRLVYGKRATPYEVLAALTHRLAAALSAEEVLPRLAEAAARGVGATSCRMRLLVPGGGERVVTWPDGASTGALEHEFTVAEHGVELGSIEIGKPAGESLRPSDRALLADVAAQAGLIFRNVRLTMELQQHLQEISAQAEQLRSSRQRIVAAAHEQRGRIEREIRSGPQAQLEQLEERLQQADGLIERDPGRAAALLSDLAAQANQTLNALRDLARGIFPALLVDQGLVPALEAHTRKQDVRLELDPTLNGLRFNAAVEAAVYFSCVGALQNAAAAPKKIHLAAHAGRLEFVAPLPKSGTLQDIRDRVEALGGSLRPCGETIEGSVPVAVEAIAAGVQ
jgi:signal transduction histidine kinase